MRFFKNRPRKDHNVTMTPEQFGVLVMDMMKLVEEEGTVEQKIRVMGSAACVELNLGDVEMFETFLSILNKVVREIRPDAEMVRIDFAHTRV